MNGFICCVLVLVGCSSHGTNVKQGPDAAPGGSAAEPRTCARHIVLPVATAETNIASLPLDTNGVDLCVSLAASQGATHFQVTSSNVAGTTSSIVARLEDGTFSPILDGWDVTVGATAPQTHMNLEWNPPVNASTVDVVVWLRGDHVVTTDISLALYVPLEN